jgi:hypothetical protein
MELNLIFGILLVVMMLAIPVIIQVLLSKLKWYWPGLILPILFFVVGFMLLLSLPVEIGWVPILTPIFIAILLLAIHFMLWRNRKLPTSDELRQMRAQDL